MVTLRRLADRAGDIATSVRLNRSDGVDGDHTVDDPARDIASVPIDLDDGVELIVPKGAGIDRRHILGGSRIHLHEIEFTSRGDDPCVTGRSGGDDDGAMSGELSHRGSSGAAIGSNR